MNLLDFYRRSRHTAVYSLDFIATGEQARESIKDAEHLLSQIKKILKT
ncbi:hypothetical protein KKG83_04580 [Candidatus Micrarchaeota archaeon]|nr:hypothetical protein [Candidatus Micrarchaeota archaeon]